MERGRIEGLPKFFEYHLLSQERVKLRTSNFARTFLVSIGTKVQLQISGKVAGCVVRTLEAFQGTHILGASRGFLCDSSAVLLANKSPYFRNGARYDQGYCGQVKVIQGRWFWCQSKAHQLPTKLISIGSILHRFRDTVTYCLKIILCIFPTPLSFSAPAPYVPFGISRWS